MMVKDRIRKIFASKAFYIVFSILASITIWLYVAYIENPNTTIEVKGIKIEFLNEDYVTDRGFVITKISANTLTLRFNGRRNTVTKLSSGNVMATVDLSKIKNTGVFQLKYDVIYPIDINQSAVSISNLTTNYIEVNVDYLVNKDIPVRGLYDGGVAEGFQAEPIELVPSTISISGPQEAISKVSYAQVTVNRENINKTVDEDLPFTIMDSDGHELKSDKITYSQDKVRVIIPVVAIKEIPLTVTYLTGAGTNDTNVTATITPSTINVSGDAETLAGLNQIVLGTIDLTKFAATTTQTFPIVLPNDTKNLTGTAEATVTVTVSGLTTSTVRTSNIETINTTSGYTATVVTNNLDIVLRGSAEELAKVKPSNIRLVADLVELGATKGTFSVMVKVYIDGDYKTVGAIGDYKVTVKLTKG
jgi:hypothetical protein